MAKSKFVPQFLRTFVADMAEHAASHGIGDAFAKACDAFCACGDKVAEDGPRVVAEIAASISPAVGAVATNASPMMAAMATSASPAVAAAAASASPAVAALLGLPVIGPLAISLGLFGVTIYMKCAREAREAAERNEAFTRIKEISAAVTELNTRQAGAAEKLVALVEGNIPLWAKISEADQASLANYLCSEFQEEFDQISTLLRIQGIRVSDINQRVRTIERCIHTIVDSQVSITDAMAVTRDELSAMIIQQADGIKEFMAGQYLAIRADMAKLAKLGDSEGGPLENLLRAAKRMDQSGDSRGEAALKLASEGNYTEAGAEAFKLAADETDKAMRLEDAAKDASRRAAARWSDAGDILFMSDQQKAAEAYRGSLRFDPDNPTVWSRLGQVELWLGRMSEALQAYTKIWYRLPDGLANLVRSVDEEAARLTRERFLRDYPGVTAETFHAMARGIVIAGIFIVEILRREPSLIRTWIMRLEKVGSDGKQRTPTEDEAPGIIQFFTERVYALGSLLGENAAQVEHRRILEEFSRIASEKGEAQLSAEYLKRAREISRQQKDVVAEAAYLCDLGIAAGQECQFDAAREYLRQALAICEGDLTQPALVVGTKLVSVEEGERRRIEAEQRAAAGLPPKRADDELAFSNFLREEFAQDTEKAFPRAIQLKVTEGNIHGNLAHVALSLHDVDLAKREFEISIAIHESVNHFTGVAQTCIFLGELALEEGDVEKTCTHWERAKAALIRAGKQEDAAYIVRRIFDVRQRAALSRAQ